LEWRLPISTIGSTGSSAKPKVTISLGGTIMVVYKRGSHGEEVRKIQAKLKALDFYRGPIDGDFGGGTYGAIRTFQKDNGLQVDGKVGPNTWKALFNKKIPKPEIHDEPLIRRCLSLTSTFETGKGIPEGFSGLSGDFDRQGISFGILQWNFGQNTLQRLLRKMNKRHPEIMKDVFHEKYPVIREAIKERERDPQGQKEEVMAFARSIQHPVKHKMFQPWKGIFRALGRVPEF
jgi:Putative peptidoglycan binding domain